MKIILIGFMGSGKSSIGKILAKEMNLEYVEMDRVTLAQSNHHSIAEIFENEGEEKFREYEAHVAEMLSNADNCVIATGGGVGAHESTLKKLRENGTVIYLQADFDTIQKRIGPKKNRPLFQDSTKAKELYDSRQAVYQKNADRIIKTDGKTKEQITQEIIQSIKDQP